MLSIHFWMVSSDLLRVFLAVAEARSFTRAARALGVSQSTVSRQVAAFEAEVGATLFSRRGREVTLTDVAESLLAPAHEVEQAMAAFSRATLGTHAEVAGTVRVATLPEIATTLLAPRVHVLMERHPGLRLELVADTHTVSLTRREADVALRLATPVQKDLVRRRIATLRYRVFALGARWPRARLRNLDDAPWLALDASLSHLPESQWLAARSREDQVRLRSTSTAALAAACATGLGLAVLPEQLARSYPGLVAVRPREPPVVERPVWLVVHRELRDSPRIRAVTTWLAELSAALA